MYYKVSLSNSSVDKSTAEIVPYNQMDGTVSVSVYSENPNMKSHLESIINQEAYVLAPGRFGPGFFADGILRVVPGTVEFLETLPEILSWQGYNCSFVNETHKSFSVFDFGFIVTKSSSQDIYQNAAGERIVKRVPPGYIAVHSDGRTVAAGGWVNANIDKEDSDWTLVENPYQDAPQHERQIDREAMEMYLQEYHPGVEEELYEERPEGEYYYTDYKPSGGKRFSDFYQNFDAVLDEEPQKVSLKPGKVFYSPATGYAVSSENWPPEIDGYDKLSWYVFEDLGLPDEEKSMYAELTGLTPQLISGLGQGVVQVEKDLDISSGFKFTIPGASSLQINPLSPERLQLDLSRDKQYAEKYRIASEAMESIKSLTSVYDEVSGRYTVSEETKNIEIDELHGLYANLAVDPYDYQKPGILALTEESQYEIYGGPKGWHGQFLNFSYGLGKVQPNDEVVYTPSGIKTMGEISPGDYVISEDGKPIKVIDVFPHKDWQFYEITFSDGSTVECGKEHLWFTKTFKDRGNERKMREYYRILGVDNMPQSYGSVKSTEEIMHSLTHRTSQGDKLNHSIQITEPVYFDEKELPIDAYVLGVFLGDGSISNTMVSSKDEEIINTLKSHLSLLRSVDEKDYYFSRKGLRASFETLGLWNKTSEDKFIPIDYLYSSVEDRVALLQGLMDTDGYAIKLSPSNLESGRSINSGAEYTTVSERLAKDVRELVLGLGGKAKISTGVGSYVSQDGDRIFCKDKYRVHISFPDGIGFNPFRLERKASVFGYAKRENWNKFIVSVKPSRVSDGACILVDSESHLYLTRDYTVTHNTAIVTAADTVMRNRGRFKSGEQVTIVTAPNKNVYVWQSEIAKFRNEDAIVIDGDRATRTKQWEDLVKRAQSNKLPNMIVVGSSKFRYSSGEEEDMLGIDARYMKLLALGGESNGSPVKGGHVSALVIDESGQYVNPGSSRHVAVHEVLESVYQGKGLTWTLNGDISGNSASDTISEVSFINKLVRDNYRAVVNDYTKPDTSAGATRSSGKEVGRRVWKDFRRMNDFAGTFRPQIYTLNGQTISGDNYGLKRTEDIGSELGHNWGTIYQQAASKLSSLKDSKQMKKALGLMNVMVHASLGAVSPARLIEYDLGTRKLMDSVSDLLKPEDYVKFREEMVAFQDRVREEVPGVGILPASIDISERNSLYMSTFSETSRAAMDRAIFSWDAPILDSIVDGVNNEIISQKPGEPPKIGIAGFSKVAMNAVYRRLLEKYGDKVVVQIIDGDTPPEEVSAKQKRHQSETGKPVISIVTSAGLYGLSLPSTRSFRLATWNSAKAGQYEGRFHRSPEQENLVTVAVPDGICQYMREIELKKRKMELETRGAVLTGGSEDEEDIDDSIAMSFISRMEQYAPRVRGEEPV